MAINFDELKPTVNNWYEREVTYTGIGYAHFENPQGWIKGNAEAKFDELGNSSCILEITEFECADCSGEFSDDMKLNWLLQGVKPVNDGGAIMTGLAPFK